MMDIQEKPTLAEKQTFWAEQLPNFESKYWLPSHFDFLAFDMDQGNYVVKDDLDPIYEEDANEIFHRVNTGWAMWKKAVNFTVNEAKASVPEKSNSVTLNCNQLKQALEFGAPDLFSETKGQYADLEFQLETEMSIEHMKDGHSGDGYYCWYTDLPEEGSVILNEEIEAQESSNG